MGSYFFSNLFVIRDFGHLKYGQVFDLSPGITIFVGETGCGKTTILEQLANRGAVRGVFSSESVENPVVRYTHYNPLSDHPFNTDSGYKIGNPITQHLTYSEINLHILKGITDVHDTLIVIDTPEVALSIKQIKEFNTYLERSVDNNNQIIVATHHPYIISNWPDVLDISKQCKIKSDQYLKREDTV
ncbi:MAG: AAA family ATPase [Alphaproteobacteria bacterium]|nr:AAA family ATPase [Alphaproteobacteria bacterium]